MWRALIFQVQAEWVEAISDALLAAGALSVDVTDAHAGTPEEVQLFAEPHWNADSHWNLAEVRALLPPEHNPEGVLRAVCDIVGMPQVPRFQEEAVADQDWVRQTQTQFSPIQVSAKLWIVPSWHEPPAPQAINLRLDPGLAFGTGSHPTTWQCLRWLATHVSGNESVLDYGCGSGILAIAALKLGAASALGVDIDPQALRTAHDNAHTNEVSIPWLAPGDLPATQRYDIVLANILANPLRALAPLLCARMRPGGHLVLAGILDRQVSEVAASFAPWVALSPFEPRDGWTCLVGQRAPVDEPQTIRSLEP